MDASGHFSSRRLGEISKGGSSLKAAVLGSMAKSRVDGFDGGLLTS